MKISEPIAALRASKPDLFVSSPFWKSCLSDLDAAAQSAKVLHCEEIGQSAGGRPHLVESLQRLRLNIVPCLNPDGRAAAAVDHLHSACLEDLFLVQQGGFPDGTLFRGRRVKETQPIPVGTLAHQGGYYNADDVNLQHVDPKPAPESEAIRSFFRREIPDVFLTMHAHGAPAGFQVSEARIDSNLSFGPRPAAHEMFAAITPAK